MQFFRSLKEEWKGSLLLSFYFLLYVAILLIGQIGCSKPTQAQPIATLQFAQTDAVPNIPPPVKHVEAKPQPTPTLVETVKAAVKKSPSIQRSQWEAIKITPQFEIAVNKAVMLYQRTAQRYIVVAKIRADGVPAPVIFCLHYRESDNDFTAHLHEGSSLSHRTRYVPKGRLLPPKEPPYLWEISAEDALYACDKNLCDRMQGNWSDLAWAFNKMELYNGAGYRKRGINSPYLYSGTQFYTSGKFVSDGHYSATAKDKQLGCLAILKRMQEKGINISFD